MNLQTIKKELKSYDGPDINLMEVCGSHTDAVARYGIPSLLSPNIHLFSGPGCPVCVTPSSYIDRLVELSLQEHTCVVSFGDLIRVQGSKKSLSQAKGEGARVTMVYSPMDILSLAEKEPETTFIFAAVGFETTTPVYALLLDTLQKYRHQKKYQNIRLLTSLKTMPEVIGFLMENGAPVHGFLAPGHVSVITGSDIFLPLAEKYQIPFVVSGFQAEELLVALHGLLCYQGQGVVKNAYPAVVTEKGNAKAKALMQQYFQKTDAVWRGLGMIRDSGNMIKEEYQIYDAGSAGLYQDEKQNPACHCDEVLMGKRKPSECPLYGTVCTPAHPQGACMVSSEGSCFSYFTNRR